MTTWPTTGVEVFTTDARAWNGNADEAIRAALADWLRANTPAEQMEGLQILVEVKHEKSCASRDLPIERCTCRRIVTASMVPAPSTIGATGNVH